MSVRCPPPPSWPRPRSAFVLADAYLEKFGADVVDDVIAACDAYRERIAL